jgi:sulfate permease, SulP family
MSTIQYSDDISLRGLTRDLRKSTWESIRADLFAGLTVAMLTVPQAMAYALVAGLPISCGLFAAIFSTIITALFGSSRHTVAGPTNAIAILIQAAVAEILFSYYRDLSGMARELMAIQILTQLTLLVGLIQVFASLFKLGRLTHFVSHAVIIGYVSGTALAVVINQLFTFFGMEIPSDVSSLFERGSYLLTHFSEIHGTTALVGLVSFILLELLKRLDQRVPAAAIMLVLAASAVYLFESFHVLSYLGDWVEQSGFIQHVDLVSDNGDIFSTFPPMAWPYFSTSIMNKLLPVAFAIALLSVMETSSVAKVIASNSGQRLSTNQEIFGLGLGNLSSSFIGAMPVSCTPSRSILNYNAGAKTRFAALFNGCFVLLILMVFGFVITRVPLAAFAALLISNAFGIINWKQFIFCLKATRADATVLLLTLSSCLFFSLDIAFYIGVILSITLYLKKAAIPQLVEFDVDEAGILHNMDSTRPQENKKIRLIKVEGELFFGAADLFQRTMKAMAEDDTTTSVIILQLKNARDIDATVCLALQQLHDYLKNSGRHLVGCGLTHHLWDVLSDSGIVNLIGKDNLFIFDERHPHQSVQRALIRANYLVSLQEVVKGEELEVEGEMAIGELSRSPIV